MNKTLIAQFQRAYGHSNNFMTPTLLGYYEIPNGVAELSEGEGIFTEKLYGVTVVRNSQRDNDNSTCFTSKQEALDYIEGGCYAESESES